MTTTKFQIPEWAFEFHGHRCPCSGHEPNKKPEDVTILNTMKLISGKHHLGDEADIFFRYQYNKTWQFTGSFGYFNPGDLEHINFKEPKDATWIGLQILFTLN